MEIGRFGVGATTRPHTLDCESHALVHQLLPIRVAQTSFKAVLKGKGDWKAGLACSFEQTVRCSLVLVADRSDHARGGRAIQPGFLDQLHEQCRQRSASAPIATRCQARCALTTVLTQPGQQRNGLASGRRT